MNTGNYENFLIREMTEGVDENHNCRDCGLHFTDCVCELELDKTEATCDWYDNFNSIEPLDTCGSDTLVQGERDPASLTSGANPDDADYLRETVNSGEDVRVFPALPEIHLPKSFKEWVKSNSGKIQ